MRWLKVLGKLLISLGVGVLLFVAWTLWGTGLLTERDQSRLEDEFAAAPAIETEPAPDLDAAIEVPDDFDPAPGTPVLRLRIPRIDLSSMVVEGVGTEELHKGPGHYPSCREGFERPLCTDFEEVWPGEKGRVIISGHRTTWGAPFYNLDKLQPGDEIVTETKWGDFTYEVTEKQIVLPDSLAIAVQSDLPELVLTTCNPRFSAAQRLIVFATMAES